jgi:hypothetical protein
MRLPILEGKDSIMATRPAEFSHASELLEVARTIVERQPNEDLVEKITILQGYLDISEMVPEDDNVPNLRKAINEVTAAVHIHFLPPETSFGRQ